MLSGWLFKVGDFSDSKRHVFSPTLVMISGVITIIDYTLGFMAGQPTPP